MIQAYGSLEGALEAAARGEALSQTGRIDKMLQLRGGGYYPKLRREQANHALAQRLAAGLLKRVRITPR